MTDTAENFVRDPEQRKALTADLPPMRMSEVVIRTRNFQVLKHWYEMFLSCKPTAYTDDSGSLAWDGNLGVCFFRIYKDFPWTQVLGLFEFPKLGDERPDDGPGIHHFQFRCPTFEDVIKRYEVLEKCGITPLKSFNHGPATSFYYQDPDQNIVEISGVNFDDEADYVHYFKTPAYLNNFDGVQIDPAEFVARYRAGESKEELTRIDG